MEKRFRPLAYTVKHVGVSLYINALLVLLNGFILPIQVVFLSRFLDAAIMTISDFSFFSTAILWLLMLVLLYIYSAFSETIISITNVRVEHRIKSNYNKLLLEKMARIKYEFTEQKSIADLIRRINDDPHLKMKTHYNYIVSLISLIISIVGIILMLFTAGWLIGLIMLFISAVVYLASSYLGKGLHDWWEKNTFLQRKYEYLSDILIGREYAAEHRIFSFKPYIVVMWDNAFSQYQSGRIKNHINALLKGNVAVSISAIFKLSIYLLLLNSLIASKITFGFYLGIARTIGNVQFSITGEMSKYLLELSKLREYWRDVDVYLKLDEVQETLDDVNICDSKTVTLAQIEFSNVFFKYPNENEYILNGVSFTILPGKSYSLVGINGAGKTTIIKLMLGLYRPTSGEIFVNGTDITRLSTKSLSAMYAVVFQDFARYYLTVEENIAFGDICHFGDISMYEEAIQKADFQDCFKLLPRGFKTYLGNIFVQGVDLSGGEWQRLAFSRAIMGDKPVMILDEPTAALDPIAEANLYTYINSIMNQKTVFFISHRLGSTKLSEKIFVLSNGIISEEGDHESLMRLGGQYAKMYREQQKWYT